MDAPEIIAMAVYAEGTIAHVLLYDICCRSLFSRITGSLYETAKQGNIVHGQCCLCTKVRFSAQKDVQENKKEEARSDI